MIDENSYGTSIYVEEHIYNHGEEESAYAEMLNPSTLNIGNVLDLIIKPERIVCQFEFRTTPEYVIEENEN